MRRLELPPDLAETRALCAMRRTGELWQLGALFGCYAVIDTFNVSAIKSPMNVVGPVAIMAILSWSCYRIAAQSSIAVWAPMFWFRLACAAYYGFGALVPHIVNQSTLNNIYSLYRFDADLNFKVNFLYCAGIFFTLLLAYFFTGWSAGRSGRSLKESEALQIA